MKITVAAKTTASPQACWTAATTPAAIVQWNAASPDWHSPRAAVDLRLGGQMTSRMEARDGSMGFDFVATFTAIDPPRRLAYRLDDGRDVELLLTPTANGTEIRQTFDAEKSNDPEFQRAGWQAILDSFVRYVESGGKGKKA